MVIIHKSSRNLLATVLLALLPFTACKEDKKDAPLDKEVSIEKPETFTTPLGKEIAITAPSEKLLAQYEEAKETYNTDPDAVDAIIWYGRRTAYLGRYDDAIDIYSEGIKKHPEEPRLYRHRGHRYISLRKFDEAISDLEKAGQLVQGTANEIEQDGMPNAQNIPVSTLHGNIWYHLGLAHYLKHEYEKAFEAYLKCRESGSLPDNIVSSTHWLYMIQRRLGNEPLANEMLQPIAAEMEVIENQSYHELCKLYKGLLPVDSLLQTETGSPSNDAVAYGVANWYFYNEEKEKAEKIMTDLTESPSWSSFGYIAAESDLIHYFGKANQ
jgi:tetratricopeptide (TPR) repeat protein